MTQSLSNELDDAAHKTADYLYKIDGELLDGEAAAIALLRQLINEEFVGKNKTVSSQFIYDLLHPFVQTATTQARLDELHRVITEYSQQATVDGEILEAINPDDITDRIATLKATLEGDT